MRCLSLQVNQSGGRDLGALFAGILLPRDQGEALYLDQHCQEAHEKRLQQV